MGQGFVLINHDKKEFVSPHDLGLGYKLGEFGYHPSFYYGNKPDFQGSLIQFARDLMETRWQGDRFHPITLSPYHPLTLSPCRTRRTSCIKWSFWSWMSWKKWRK